LLRYGESLRKNTTWLMIIVITLYSNYALSYNISNIEQKLNHQISINPKAVFYEIESLLVDPELNVNLKAILMVLQSEVAYFIDQPEHILKYSRAALATGLLTDTWHARVLISQSRGYFQRGQFNEFYATANMAVIKTEQYNLSTYKISALVERAYANNLLGNNDQAIKDLALAIKYLELMPNVFDKAIILERFSAVNKRLGNIKVALKYQHQANIIYEKIDTPHYLSIGYYNLARIYQAIENWQDASVWMLKSYRQALKDKNKLNQAFSLSRLSEYQNNLGNIKEANKYLNEAIIAADLSASERVKIHVRKNMAKILAQNKAFIECKTLLLETITLAETYQMERDKIELMQMLAETYFSLGDFESAYITLKSAK
jgi:tetratricopeptide (TPR) repeat protein|tara:strand:- start:842 stop:1966 length:1125 start_codon:yes stop_codon:yes gene_type:complete